MELNIFIHIIRLWRLGPVKAKALIIKPLIKQEESCTFKILSLWRTDVNEWTVRLCCRYYLGSHKRLLSVLFFFPYPWLFISSVDSYYIYIERVKDREDAKHSEIPIRAQIFSSIRCILRSISSYLFFPLFTQFDLILVFEGI